MDLLVLRKQFQLFSECRHLLGEDGEDVLFLDGVVDCEVVAELLAHGEEGLDGHALWALLGFAGGVEDVPGGAKIVVEVVHVICHGIVLAKFRWSQLWQSLLLAGFYLNLFRRA